VVSEKLPNRGHRSLPPCWIVYTEEIHPLLVRTADGFQYLKKFLFLVNFDLKWPTGIMACRLINLTPMALRRRPCDGL
jgi:hypothetical protein